MRSDILVDRKCIHIKLPKEAHLAMRQEALSRNISVQTIVSELAISIARKENWAIKFLDRIVTQAIKKSLEAAQNPQLADLGKRIGSVDDNTIYALIQSLRDDEAAEGAAR
jgi:hypothetical protein